MKVLSESCFRYSEAGPFFAEVKDDLDMAQDGYVSPIEYFMVVDPDDPRGHRQADKDRHSAL